MSTYRDSAIVLGSYKFGEADRVVVLLSESHGKIRVVAKGVRKTKSSIGARLEPMSYVDISLRRGRELDTVDQVKLLDTFSQLRTDFDRLRQGLAMVEAVNKITPDREPVPELFALLSRALTALNKRQSPLLLAAFFWRLISVEGQAPQLESCVRCGDQCEGFVFDITEGGVHCPACGAGRPISDTALGIMRDMLGGHMNHVLDLPESPAVTEVNVLAMDAMEAHLERRLKSLGVFDRHL